MRLHSRIYLHSLVVLLALAVAVSVVFALVNRGPGARDLAERAARHVATLSAERVKDPPALEQRLAQLHADLGLDITVRDLDGRVIATSGAALPSPPLAVLAEARTRALIRHMGWRMRALAPVDDPASGAVVATVEVALRDRHGLAGLARPLLFVAIVLLVVAVATRPLARRLSRPLERLTTAARRLGEGDLSARAPAAEPRRRSSAHDEMQELTRAFNQMAERLERLVRGQKELLANVSHELRSPLARVRLALELVPRQGETQARLRAIQDDLAELERLIDDVLTTARLDATGLPSELGPVETASLLAGLADRAHHDPLLAGQDVRVVDGSSHMVIGDERLLRRALWNLVENAGKYGAPPITLAAVADGPYVKFSVSDAGPGIPAEARARVLDPFYRLDRSGGRLDRSGEPDGDERPAGGFGLGLALARRVAEVHGGTISIESAGADGREPGCRVTIRIPSGTSAGEP